MANAAPVVKHVLHFVQQVYGFIFRLAFIGPIFDVVTATMASLFTFLNGSFAAIGYEKSKRPQKPLILYEFVACPFCRKVMETISVLALDVVVYPCPRSTLKRYGEAGGSRFRQKALEIGGKTMFPLLIDENTNKILYESSDIVEYLWNEYGDQANQPLSYRLARFFSIGNFLRNIIRPLSEQGLLKLPSQEAKKPLILWGYEGSPFVLRAREALCSLELPYLYKTVPKFARDKRQEYLERFEKQVPIHRKRVGLIQVPVLEDPNSGDIIFESADIVKYLYKTYKTGDAEKESFLDYTTEGALKEHGKLE